MFKKRVISNQTISLVGHAESIGGNTSVLGQTVPSTQTNKSRSLNNQTQVNNQSPNRQMPVYVGPSSSSTATSNLASALIEAFTINVPKSNSSHQFHSLPFISQNQYHNAQFQHLLQPSQTNDATFGCHSRNNQLLPLKINEIQRKTIKSIGERVRLKIKQNNAAKQIHHQKKNKKSSQKRRKRSDNGNQQRIEEEESYEEEDRESEEADSQDDKGSDEDESNSNDSQSVQKTNGQPEQQVVSSRFGLLTAINSPNIFKPPVQKASSSLSLYIKRRLQESAPAQEKAVNVMPDILQMQKKYLNAPQTKPCEYNAKEIQKKLERTAAELIRSEMESRAHYMRCLVASEHERMEYASKKELKVMRQEKDRIKRDLTSKYKDTGRRSYIERAKKDALMH